MTLRTDPASGHHPEWVTTPAAIRTRMGPVAEPDSRAGGQLIASGRIPIQAIVASLEAEAAATSEGD